MVKVPSDPAQVIVNHASFRVQLGVSARRAQSPRIARHVSAAEDTARIPVVTTVGTPGQSGARRRPVVWSGRSAPDDTGAHRLLQAVRHEGVRHADEPLTDAGATQVIPRTGTGYDPADDPVARTLETPFVGAQRRPADGPLLPPMRTVGSVYDEPAYDEPAYDDGYEDTGRRAGRHGDDPARHAYYPGRRMNLGVVLPQPGYLEAVREITKKHGILWIVDEVKTGLCVAPGGATDKFNLSPDMVTLAKALGGGLPSGAIGGTSEVMDIVRSGKVYQVGTYNGNPLTMAAARASLLEVLTPDAYDHLNKLNDHLLAGCDAVLKKYDLPGYTVGISSKGCVTFSPVEITDYESFKANQDGEITELAWLYAMNRGIYMTPGREEEWTLSIQHSIEDCDKYIAMFEELCHDLTA